MKEKSRGKNHFFEKILRKVVKRNRDNTVRHHLCYKTPRGRRTAKERSRFKPHHLASPNASVMCTNLYYFAIDGASMRSNLDILRGFNFDTKHQQ